MIGEVGYGPVVAVIAFFYSMVGWAGGSAYAALFAGAGLEPASVKILSLSLNIWVSAVVWMQFSRAGHFRLNTALPFAVLSFPAAWFGAKISMGRGPFLLLIGLCLVTAASRLLVARATDDEARPLPLRAHWVSSLPTGALFGFLSGLAGIGGGIFLTPFLILTKRATLKEAAAASSFFIFINSVAGLWSRGRLLPVPPGDLGSLVVWALVGGILGSSLGAGRLPVRLLRAGLAIFLIFFSFDLFSKAFAGW